MVRTLAKCDQHTYTIIGCCHQSLLNDINYIPVYVRIIKKAILQNA